MTVASPVPLSVLRGIDPSRTDARAVPARETDATPRIGSPAAAAPDADGTVAAVLGRAALLLHQGSRQWPASQFPDRAAEVLLDCLHAQALLWGSVRAGAPAGTPLSAHGVHSVGLEPAAVMHCLRGLPPPGALSATAVDATTQRRMEVHVWRTPPAPPFGPDDRRLLALLLPHLLDTRRECLLAAVADLGAGGGEDEGGRTRRSVALCDLDAVLHHADEQALVLLRTEWPRWSGSRLPESLAGAVAAAAVDDDALGRPGTVAAQRPLPAFYGRHVTVRLQRCGGDGIALEVRRRADADRLSRRQRDIAALYAQGHTGPQIAARLGLMPSTVNNHLGVVFKKLGVRNKLQLLQALRAAGIDTTVCA